MEELSHYLENEIGINLPHRRPLILCNDFCHPQEPTIIRVFSNYCKVVAFVNNSSGCLRGDTSLSPQQSLETKLDQCMHVAIAITLDLFFSQHKYWKEEILSVPIKHSDILWLLQRRPNKPGKMNVFKYTKMCSTQYPGTNNCPRFSASSIIFLNNFSIWQNITIQCEYILGCWYEL